MYHRVFQGKKIILSLLVIGLLLFSANMIYAQTTWWGGTMTAWIEEMVSAFEKENPDIKVICDVVSSSGYTQKFLTQRAAGTGPDIVQVDDQWTGKLLMYNVAVDITPFLEADKMSLSHIHEAHLKGYRKRWTGEDPTRLYGLPFIDGGYGLIYNRDMYREVGLEFPTQGNWNVDKFMADAARLTRDTDGDGKIDIWAASGGIISSCQVLASRLARQAKDFRGSLKNGL